MVICGVDPGLHTTGYAVVTVDRGAVQVRDAGVCRTQLRDPLARRLADIQADFFELFEQQRPAVVAVEKLYTHYKHPRTAVVMGHVRGVILAAAARFDLRVEGYSATQIKRYLTGNGRATKHQVQHAVMRELNLPHLPEPPDVADALAIALCCAGDGNLHRAAKDAATPPAGLRTACGSRAQEYRPPVSRSSSEDCP